MASVGIIAVYTDHQRRGKHHRGVLQPQIGPLIAALLPDDADIHILNDTWDDPDWARRYDLLFLSCLHSDFDRARQISHYWRQRGTRTVIGGIFASTHASLCAPFFDAVAIGDPETTVPRIWQDFLAGSLRPLYVADAYDPAQTPVPRFAHAARQQVLPIGIETSRGCPFTCEFCALTAAGTRFQARPPELIVRDIVAGRHHQSRLASWTRRNIVAVYDNNLGGSKKHLRELCAAMEGLGVYWGVCITFNNLRDDDTLARLARAGCRGLFVGLESFNPVALEQMGKRQNVLAEVREAIARCHRHGIIVMAGMMLSPVTDDVAYIDSIPERLADCGLHVPTYVSFETPFPGTPHFKRLAAEESPAFMPDALLRDFNGYTLVSRPRHASPEEFVDAYRRLVRKLFSRRARMRKLFHDAASFLKRGFVVPLLYDAVELASERGELPQHRTFIAGTDMVPPEYCGGVPLGHGDFATPVQRDAVLAPLPVTDHAGRVLPFWLEGYAERSGPLPASCRARSAHHAHPASFDASP